MQNTKQPGVPDGRALQQQQQQQHQDPAQSRRAMASQNWIVIDGNSPGSHGSQAGMTSWAVPKIPQQPQGYQVPGLLKPSSAQQQQSLQQPTQSQEPLLQQQAALSIHTTPQLTQPLAQPQGSSRTHSESLSHRYDPYPVPHSTHTITQQSQQIQTQFTIYDIDKCLYGKQELRVVQVDTPKAPPSGASAEDKNKPAKWCDMCQEIRFGECPKHGPLPSLRPTVTLTRPKTYAISTFPDEVGLCMSTLPLTGYGVFARHLIPCGTWIGPYEGKKISVADGLKQIQEGDAPFLWEIYENFRLCHFLDASDENTSSWMRFIQCARHTGEQNLFVFQYYGSIYYRAFKDIPVGTELMVWYDDKYPQYFGMPCQIQDMSSYSMESIQPPMEVSKIQMNTDPTRPHAPSTYPPSTHHPSTYPPATYPPSTYPQNNGKMISSAANIPGGRERIEPHRMSLNRPIRPQLLHNHHVSTIIQTRPMQQPPTLIQAPTITGIHHSTHSSVYVSSSQNPSTHPPLPPRPSPRQLTMTSHSLYGGGESSSTNQRVPRSSSLEDMRKRSMMKINFDRNDRDYFFSSHSAPPMGSASQVVSSQKATLHYSSTAYYSSKVTPAVMSVAPRMVDNNSKLKIDDSSSSSSSTSTDVGIAHGKGRVLDRQRLAREPDRDLQAREPERELSAREPERELLSRECERERSLQHEPEHLSIEIDSTNSDKGGGGGGGLPPFDPSRHDNSMIAPREPLKKGGNQTLWDVFRCNGCGETFQQKCALSKHVCVSEGSKPFQCGRCQLSFTEVKHLQDHMVMHNSDRPFKCGVCSRSFSGASTLANHMQLHNTPLSEKDGGQQKAPSLDCEKCGKRFLQDEDLMKHVSTPGLCTT